MARSINKVTLLGHLGADPEVRTFQDGGRIANFTLATNRNWRDLKTGEKRERTEWHRISMLGPGLVGLAEKYLSKGSRVYLEGQLSTRKWQAEDGMDRYTTEIVLRAMDGVLVLLDRKAEPGDEPPDEAPNLEESLEDIPS